MAVNVPEAIADADRVRELVDRLEYLTEQDVQALADVRPSTVEAWRARGLGPPYVRIGRRYIYPIAGFMQWLNTREQARREKTNHG
jgi:hypothetical protein